MVSLAKGISAALGLSQTSSPVGLSTIAAPLSPSTPTSAKSVFRLAIAEGVPLFNSGNVKGCLAIYQQAGRNALSLPLGEVEAERVRMGMAESLMASGVSAKAWALRRMMDEVSAMPSTASMSNSGKSLLQASTMRACIDRALSKGIPLYNSGDPGGCANVYMVCAKGLLKSLEMESEETQLLGPAEVARLKRGLEASVRAACKASHTLSEKAWDLRGGLDLVAEALQLAGVSSRSTRRGARSPFVTIRHRQIVTLDFGDDSVELDIRQETRLKVRPARKPRKESRS
jgi:hypothetical protein